MVCKNLLTKILVLLTIITLVQSHSIPIFRHQNKTAQQLKQSNQCGSVGPNNSTILGFGNCFQNIYYINIEIGSPSQTLGVQFDTGSNTLWVPTQLVTGVTPIFNTTQSSTFTNTSQQGGVQVSLSYVDGSGVNGTYGTDVFKIQGSVIDITTTYLWVTQQQMNFPPQIQGLVGMGYTTTPNFLDVAYQNGQIQSPVFALQLKDQTQNSVIHYNELPQQIVNQTIFVPVYGNVYWAVQVNQVLVGGIDMSSYAANVAVIDSGTSYFYVNQELYSNILSNFFSSCNIFSTIVICSCSSVSNWPEFAFTFNGVQVFIKPQQYAAQLSNTSSFCTPNFGSISGFSQILLGDIFFRSYIITFDKINQQIGFYGQNMVPVTPIFTPSLTVTVLSIILLVIIVILILIGLCVLCCIESFLSSLLVKPLTLDLRGLELAGTAKLDARFL